LLADDRVFARRVIIAISLAGLFAILFYTADLLLMAFAGVLGAVLVDAAARWIGGRLHTGRRVSYSIVLACAALLVAGALWFAVPRMIVQINQLTDVLPQALANARAYLDQFAWGKVITSRVGDVNLSLIAGQITAIIKALVGIGVAVTVMIVLTAYLGEDPGYYRRGVLSLLPVGWRQNTDRVFHELAETLRWWLIGQSIPMAVLGVVTLIALLLLHIPLAFTLSIFTGAMIFIPFAGAVIAYIATAIVTISVDPSKLLLVTILFLGVHILEGYVLTPLVQKRAVYLPPAVTIIAEVLMSTLFGFLGLILATPIAAAVRVVVKRLYVDRMAATH